MSRTRAHVSIRTCAVLAALVGAQATALECPVPTVQRAGFSATEVALLASELQQAVTPGCYAVVSTSLVVCLQDLSLSSGCCTAACARSFHLALTPECLFQFWDYVCANTTVYASYVSGVVERCLPATSPDLVLSCPLNASTSAAILPGAGLLGVQGGAAAGLELPPDLLANLTAAALPEARRDRDYYSGCAREAPMPWTDFNGSMLFDSLLAFARDVPQECLRTAIAHLASCYDDLTFRTGCCSLRCRAAVQNVPLSCYISYLRSLCARIPNLTKYFFSTAQRCAGLNVTCDVGYNESSGLLESSGMSALPLVASPSGQCPLAQVLWPSFNTVATISATLQLLAGSPESCKTSIPRISSACFHELGVQLGCCSTYCAIAMRSVPDTCHAQFRQQLCATPDVAAFTVALANRCLGKGAYPDCDTQGTG